MKLSGIEELVGLALKADDSKIKVDTSQSVLPIRKQNKPTIPKPIPVKFVWQIPDKTETNRKKNKSKKRS